MTNDQPNDIEHAIAQYKATLGAVGDTANMLGASHNLAHVASELVALVRHTNTMLEQERQRSGFWRSVYRSQNGMQAMINAIVSASLGTSAPDGQTWLEAVSEAESWVQESLTAMQEAAVCLESQGVTP